MYMAIAETLTISPPAQSTVANMTCRWPIILTTGVISLFLWTWTFFASLYGGRLAGDFELAPSQYHEAHPATRLTVGAGEGLLRIKLNAPVENSWLSVNIKAVADDGSVAAQAWCSLSYYHGITESKEWQTGSRQTAALMQVPRGNYRLTIQANAGGGNSSQPDFDRFAVPLQMSIWTGAGSFRVALVLATVVSILTGVLTLYRLSNNPARRIASLSDIKPQRSERFLMLDALRGIAALAVVFCHLLVPEVSDFSAALSSSIPPPLAALVRHGDLGVEIFFVLSGFVIAYSVRDRMITPGFAARFAFRRALRLDPPYYFALLISVAFWAYYLPFGLAQVMDEMSGFRGMLANLAYLQDLLKYRTPLSIAWTLCLEVQFYLAYIGLLFVTQTLTTCFYRTLGRSDRDFRSPPPLALALVFFPLVAWSFCSWYPNLRQFDFSGTWFRFFLGVLLCWVYLRVVPRWWLTALLVLLAVLAIRTSDARGCAALATTLLIDTAGRLGTLASWLSTDAVQVLGRMSYSLYLVHIPLGLSVANIAWSFTDSSAPAARACALIAVAASLLFALVVYKLVEAPSVAISKQITY
jgi:peptidoglycan/LPS O-acetylase OafA/YrhL